MKNTVPTHQTVRLARGKHSSPREGACVMELASMLADEPFSDRPFSVSPAIGGFLRAYNDFVGDRQRQDLYRLATAVVGTRATSEIEMLRVRRVIEWSNAVRGSRPWDRLARTLHRDGPLDGLDPDEAGHIAVRAIGRKRRQTHSLALALVDELIAYGQPGTHATNRATSGSASPNAADATAVSPRR